MRRITVTIAGLLLALATMAAPATADHEHDIDTPGACASDVGRGQTSIDDDTHGGYHRFHDNVHRGAADDEVLGKGNSRVGVGLGLCAS